MIDRAASRRQRAAWLLMAVVGWICFAHFGALVANVAAQSTNSTMPTPISTPDLASDVVAATAAEFRVDELGAATYSIPLYGVPGTAGVSPQLSLVLKPGWPGSDGQGMVDLRAVGDFPLQGDH